MTYKLPKPRPDRKRLRCLNCNAFFDVEVDQETHECPNCGLEICNHCGGLVKIQYENNGFEAPDPTHEDPVGSQCTICGHKVKF